MESELGLSVLLELIGVEWARDEDNDIAIGVGNVIISNPRPEPVKPTSRWWK